MWKNTEIRFFSLHAMIGFDPNGWPWRLVEAWRGRGVLVDWERRDV